MMSVIAHHGCSMHDIVKVHECKPLDAAAGPGLGEVGWGSSALANLRNRLLPKSVCVSETESRAGRPRNRRNRKPEAAREMEAGSTGYGATVSCARVCRQCRDCHMSAAVIGSILLLSYCKLSCTLVVL